MDVSECERERKREMDMVGPSAAITQEHKKSETIDF